MRRPGARCPIHPQHTPQKPGNGTRINEEMNSKKRLSESRDTINALQQKIEQMKTAAECRQEDNMPDLQDHGTEDDEEKDNEPKREYNTLEQIEKPPDI